MGPAQDTNLSQVMQTLAALAPTQDCGCIFIYMILIDSVVHACIHVAYMHTCIHMHEQPTQDRASGVPESTRVMKVPPKARFGMHACGCFHAYHS